MKFLILLFIGNLALAQTDTSPSLSAKSTYLVGRNINGVVSEIPVASVVNSLSTSAPLGAGASFTSAFVDITQYAGVSLLIGTPQGSAIGGAKVIFSADCINDHRILTTTIPASAANAFFFSIPKESKCIKTSYVNGSVSQTTFTFQTIANTTTIGPSYVPIIASIDDFTSVDITRAIIGAKKENGTYDNIGASNSGGLKVAITDRPSEVRNRTRVEKRIFRDSLTASGTVVHTVTPGKTFYLSSFIMSSINNANAIGEWRVRDGVTDKLGFVTSEKITGAAAPSSAQSPNLPEPIPFTTNIDLYEISGDMQVSFYIIGYEENN